MHKYVSFLDKSIYLYQEDGLIPLVDIEDEYNKLYDEYGAKFIKECHKINNATGKRIRRLRDRITRYVNAGKSIFVTLTFNNETLDHTSVETRRKYVQRFLKEHSNMYVANIDYGVDDKYTHREHYHAIVVVDRIDKSLWTYGYSFCEVVRATSDEKKLAKYITKLCNHAIKDSTKRCCYIYSRS